MINKLIKGNLASNYEIATKMNELVEEVNGLLRWRDLNDEKNRPEPLFRLGEKVWVEYAGECYIGKIVGQIGGKAIVKAKFTKNGEMNILRTSGQFDKFYEAEEE